MVHIMKIRKGRTVSDFVLPESMLRMALPIGLKFVMRFIFRSAKEHPDECEAARKDIDKRLSAALHDWITIHE